MKYVAFLDILGFKNRLRELEQNKAKIFISDFSGTIFSIFKSPNLKSGINGYIVSDSLILYSDDTRSTSLYNLIEVIKNICESEFIQNGILMRGAIAKGEFDRVPAIELPKLEKQLIVGQAYVDAFLLESSVKVLGVNISKDVYDDILSMGITMDVIEEKIGQETCYLFRYINSDFLLNRTNMKKFIEHAMKSKWLPHYYNAIYFAIKNVTNERIVEQIFANIEKLVCDNSPNEKWRELDLYIRNVFAEGVIDNFKVRFLKHIRKKLFLDINS